MSGDGAEWLIVSGRSTTGVLIHCSDSFCKASRRETWCRLPRGDTVFPAHIVP